MLESTYIWYQIATNMRSALASPAPKTAVNAAIGSCAHAVTASWAIVCFAQRAQVGGQVARGGRCVGVVLAEDTAAAVEGVLVQVPGGL